MSLYYHHHHNRISDYPRLSLVKIINTKLTKSSSSSLVGLIIIIIIIIIKIATNSIVST